MPKARCTCRTLWLLGFDTLPPLPTLGRVLAVKSNAVNAVIANEAQRQSSLRLFPERYVHIVDADTLSMASLTLSQYATVPAPAFARPHWVMSAQPPFATPNAAATSAAAASEERESLGPATSRVAAMLRTLDRLASAAGAGISAAGSSQAEAVFDLLSPTVSLGPAAEAAPLLVPDECEPVWRVPVAQVQAVLVASDCANLEGRGSKAARCAAKLRTAADGEPAAVVCSAAAAQEGRTAQGTIRATGCCPQAPQAAPFTRSEGAEHPVDVALRAFNVACALQDSVCQEQGASEPHVRTRHGRSARPRQISTLLTRREAEPGSALPVADLARGQGVSDTLAAAAAAMGSGGVLRGSVRQSIESARRSRSQISRAPTKNVLELLWQRDRHDSSLERAQGADRGTVDASLDADEKRVARVHPGVSAAGAAELSCAHGSGGHSRRLRVLNISTRCVLPFLA